MINKLWLSICIVCIIILSVVVSLVILYGSNVFDYANESYNDRAMLALFGLGLLSAIGVYATYGKISPKTDERVYETLPPMTTPIQTSVALPTPIAVDVYSHGGPGIERRLPPAPPQPQKVVNP